MSGKASFWVLATRFKRCPSDKILVVYGKVGKGQSAKIAAYDAEDGAYILDELLGTPVDTSSKFEISFDPAAEFPTEYPTYSPVTDRNASRPGLARSSAAMPGTPEARRPSALSPSPVLRNSCTPAEPPTATRSRSTDRTIGSPESPAAMLDGLSGGPLR